MFRPSRLPDLGWLCLGLSLSIACDDGEKPSGASASASVAAASASAASSQHPNYQLSGFEVAPGKFAIPVGPRLLLEPGKGAGPVRFGATVETIERQMGMKCQDLSPTFCGITTAAIDFVLTDGKVSEIRVHRIQRPSTPDRSGTPRLYGVFNGKLIKNVSLGMYRGLVKEALGEPLRSDTISEPNAFGTYEIDHYQGMSLEFDRLKNNNNVLGGVILRPMDAPLPPVATKPLSTPPARPATPAPSASK
ncbi:MAG: hypothetical protein KC766_23265 [Myxococcales bacterium]|nr:hypothetical protein [Myxococcales bacterium]